MKRSAKEDKNNYFEQIAEGAAARGETSAVYKITREIRRNVRICCSTTKDKEGNKLTSKEEILNRRKEHFSKVFIMPDPQRDFEEEGRCQS